MAPQRRAKSKVSATEAAATPITPRAKRSRTSAVEAHLAQAAEEEANNSTHGYIVGNATRPAEGSLPPSNPGGESI